MIKAFKYDVGLYICSANPLDLASLNIIYKSACECSELFIILNYQDNDLIDYKLRYQWIYKLTNHFDNISIIPLELNFNSSFDNSKLNLRFIFDYIKNNFNREIDVFYLNSYLGIDSKLNKLSSNFLDKVIIENCHSNCPSLEEIHNNPFKYWELIPNIVREYYVKKVLIIGNESTGKSTLVQTLGNLYNTNYVLEYSRDVCSNCGGEDYMITEDFEEILYQHKLNIKKGCKKANKLLFIDTDSFMTYYYRKHAGLLDSDEKESILDIEDNIRLISGEYDLILFMESDVPYVQDDLRILDRNENGLRESCTEIIKEIYKNNNMNFKIISGSYGERLEKAQSLIKEEFDI